MNNSKSIIIATLKDECDIKQLFDKLSIGNRFVSVKFKTSQEFSIQGELNNTQKMAIEMLKYNHLEIMIKLNSGCRFFNLYKKQAVFTGYANIHEASEIMNHIDLNVSEIKKDFRFIYI